MTGTMKRIREVHANPGSHWVGDGFPVRTLFSAHSMGKEVSPFLLLDYAGPMDFPPSDESKGVDEHPHRGFETVTIVYQGELEHRDSAGNRGRIGPGDVQWMTAASGVVHEEKHAEDWSHRGGTFEVVQLWVNLPANQKMSPPAYQELTSDRIPVVEVNGSGSIRVIAGEYDGVKGPARTFTPVNVWDVRLNQGGRIELDVPDGHNALVAVLRGEVALNGSDAAGEAELALFEPAGESIWIEARKDSTILVLSGEPIDEPIAAYGPFVMNTQHQIAQAMQDYQAGKMGHLR